MPLITVVDTVITTFEVPDAANIGNVRAMAKAQSQVALATMRENQRRALQGFFHPQSGSFPPIVQIESQADQREIFEGRFYERSKL